MSAKVLMIDNYDSFTYNIVQYLGELGADVVTHRSDAISLDDIRHLAPSHLVLSPGPGDPDGAGITLDAIRTFAGQLPILGVCLGHQAIGQVFGARLENLSDVFHGVQTPIRLTATDEPLFAGLTGEFTAGRYHSWVVSREGFPDDTLQVTAESPDGYIMALRHRTYPVHGIQFHPESILTPVGEKIIRNFLAQ